MSNNPFVRVIAVTGGKGGVGKTNASVNLAIQLARLNQRVLLLDADLGLANVDIQLGLKPAKNLEHVLLGDASLRDVIIEGPEGIRIIPASSGVATMASLEPSQHVGLISAFSELANDIDVLIVDTAAGISDTVVSFVKASQEVLVVVCDEPSSVTDAYALIKVLNSQHSVDRYRIIVNQVADESEARRLFGRLVTTTDKFLDVILQYQGYIPFDPAVKKAVKMQKAVSTAFPSSPASRAYKKIADQLYQLPKNHRASGQLQFFIEQVVATAQA